MIVGSFLVNASTCSLFAFSTTALIAAITAALGCVSLDVAAAVGAGAPAGVDVAGAVVGTSVATSVGAAGVGVAATGVTAVGVIPLARPTGWRSASIRPHPASDRVRNTKRAANSFVARIRKSSTPTENFGNSRFVIRRAARFCLTLTQTEYQATLRKV